MVHHRTMQANDQDRLGAIEAFVAVGRRLSFGEAARDLGISPSALSRRIAKLEERLDCRLLQRSTRHVSLTEAGREFLDSCRDLLTRAEEAVAALSVHASEPAGVLRIRMPTTYGQRRIAPLLASFMATHPKVRLELMMDDKPIDPVETTDDISLRIGNIDSGDFVARRLEPLGSVLCASPRYLSRRKPPAAPADLAAHDCLQLRYPGTAGRWRLSRGVDAAEIDFQPIAAADDVVVLKELVLRDRGIALLPRPIVQADLDAGALVQVLPDWGGPQLWVYLIYPNARHLPRRTRAFIDFLIKAIETEPMADDPKPKARPAGRSRSARS